MVKSSSKTPDTTAPSMAVDIGGIRMRNPVMVASGTFGYGPEYADLVDLNALGALVVKGIRIAPWDGNPTPRMVEVPGGLVNAIGLQGPGVDGFIADYLPFLRGYEVPVIVNIWGRSLDEYREVAQRLDGVPGIAGIELNISCPNVKEGGLAFGTQPDMARSVIAAVRRATRLPLIPKLSPNVSDIRVFAAIAEAEGADAISLINSYPAMVIDVRTRRPVLANRVGGLSGPAIHPIAVKLVWEAARAVKIPVVGMGGITGPQEALEFLIAGARAVAVGTANFTDPTTALRVRDGIRDYLAEQGMHDIGELIGSLAT
ncbi:MAG: dihydroorotate dehydrogenase B catalytic subunit [Lentisphaerae bacterium RIFOXYC12_FULL_60_16]|nr:MAG: dihydroorotate dehydrogenase B catalytic subunit [Lentisphaerae bacterium RIFOXYC12_FULL_60_16]OGV70764.1 MAG: dihydroorotate dehydrogenase B catalytic subunit [Lentisphaerae bacterium RIFOXYA12_FULL_60_10]OGV86971.1 MAG: dihydroorotate dehydrogenase B catalytic subunit [Lentisphaerae bacterium RIFOXYB12_FULL_60_10]